MLPEIKKFFIGSQSFIEDNNSLLDLNKEGIEIAIPPPNPLLAIKYCAEDFSKHRISNKDSPKNNKHLLRTLKTSTKDSISPPILTTDTINKDELIKFEKESTEKVILQNENLYRFSLYRILLEANEANYIVYNRNGKMSNKGGNTESNCTLKIEDFKKLLEAHQQKGVASWKWNFTDVKPYYIPRDIDDETLIFESRFESGNLELAIKVSDTEYNLLLQNDSLTNGNTQWFYFKVSNTRYNKRVTFNILNFVLF